MISMEEYLDKVYKGKEVIHTYKIHDTYKNKQFWQEWEGRMRKVLRDIDMNDYDK